MIRRYLDKLGEFQAGWFHGRDCLIRRHSQLCLWSTWFAQDRRFLAWKLMPVDDGKATRRLERFAHSLRQTELVRNAMKSIRHKDKVNRVWHERCKLVGVSRYEIAISDAALFETM